MLVLTTVLLGASAYLLGSIPFGLLIARARGVDIRSVGSGNIGATNVFRCVGKMWGILTFAGDVLKGFAASFLLVRLAVAAGLVEPPPSQGVALFGACMAVAGHNWPVFLRFKGGKGVATTVGGLLGIVPAAMGIGLLIWLLVFLASRYVSLASVLAAVSVSIYIWITRPSGTWLLPGVMTLLSLLIIWRHQSNIRRLASGTEHRFACGRKNAS